MHRPQRVPVTVITRYLIAELRDVFLLAMATFVGLYLVVDFFDRLGSFLKYDASAWAAARYMAFKVPLIVTHVVPPAAMAATLVSLGLLARRGELLALRASGVSLYRIAAPLLAAGLAISLCMLAWNEIVVPYGTRQSQEVNLLEIRRQAPRTILSDREIWYHGADGFYNIDHIDRDRQTLYGVVLYRVGADFRLQSVISIPEARWAGERWDIRGGTERRVLANSEIAIDPVPSGTILRHETLADFLEVYRHPDELPYAVLRERIERLSEKGIDTSRFMVDLHLKLAVPFMSLVLTALAIPVAARNRRHPSIALTASAGIVVGFAYWVVLALAVSLGHSGALPPLAAAWAANATFALAGAVLLLTID